MKLGIFYGGTNEVAGQVEAVVQAENDGFDSLWMGQVFGPDVMTVLALAGQKTSRIQVGTSVVPTYTRHPHIMAQQALTTHAATNGRFNLGLGLSHHTVVEGMWGLSYDRPGVNMKEYLSVVMPLVNEGSVDFSGDFHRARASLQIPVPNPMPVLIAALAPMMLRLAGELADGTITWMAGPRALESHIVPRLTRAASAAGRPAPRVVAGIPIAVVDDVAAAREKAARAFRVYGSLPNYQRVLGKEGVDGPEDIAIVGDEAECERRIKDFASVGVTEFLAAFFPVGDDPHASLARTRALCKSLVGRV